MAMGQLSPRRSGFLRRLDRKVRRPGRRFAGPPRRNEIDLRDSTINGTDTLLDVDAARDWETSDGPDLAGPTPSEAFFLIMLDRISGNSTWLRRRIVPFPNAVDQNPKLVGMDRPGFNVMERAVVV